ncbi:late secretory pathway protein AVL9 homolog [Ptychodera flava]|uniref:late secretory pathway protein AVL9 homolog n=1 Tax=Ptychodera flava TaxID=63121 RepID=UPI00396A3502
MAEVSDQAEPVLHVIVVGFHHKRGCQVDFSYPPLIEGQALDSHEVPTQWKYLPFLALPDGAHNFTEDTVYFHIPDQHDPNQTIYGVSCFRQIESKDLINRSADMTRGTVLKSVCVLSKLPLYGLFQAKLQLITYAYFKERDFSKTEILKELFESLSVSISGSLTGEPSQLYLGLSVRDLIMRFKHKVRICFKLLMLERRVLIFGAPVKTLCGTILSFVSLFPEMIEMGLSECTSYDRGRPITTDLELTQFGIETEDYLDVKISDIPDYSKGQTRTDQHGGSPVGEDTKKVERNPMLGRVTSNDCAKMGMNNVALKKTIQGGAKNEIATHNDRNLQINMNAESHVATQSSGRRTSDDDLLDMIDRELCNETDKPGVNVEDMEETRTDANVRHVSHNAEDGLSNSNEAEADEEYTIINSPRLPNYQMDNFGFPLALFTKGSVCHPYISLQQHDLLQDINVRSFLIGATNCLYKQKKHLLDIIIDLEDNKIQIQDNELRKQLNLSTADLRFADVLVRNVLNEKENTFLDPTGWEGGEEWLRRQFKLYVQALLATVEFSDDEDDLHDFNVNFVKAWKTTHNYRVWKNVDHSAITKEHQKHPCHGNLSVSDMRLRLRSTDQGRKISNAVSKTGSAVVQTGRIFGGALTTAKSAVSSTVTAWFSGLMDDDKTDSETED